jgi:NADP-dependent 3-hydroxy acid dehydrogenase YdfG
MLEAATARMGGVDILVNNAGILRTSHVDSFDLAELEPLIAINYTAVVRTSILFARHMKTRGSGQIVNLSSIGASLTAAGTGVYGGLKAALERFTDVLRIELAGSGLGQVFDEATAHDDDQQHGTHGAEGQQDFAGQITEDDQTGRSRVVRLRRERSH